MTYGEGIQFRNVNCMASKSTSPIFSKVPHQCSQKFITKVPKSTSPMFPKVSQQNDSENNTQTSDSFYAQHDNFDGVSSKEIPIPAIFFEKNSEFIFFTRTNIRKYKESKSTTFQWVRYRVETSPTESNLYHLTRQTISKIIYDKYLEWEKSPVFSLIDHIKKIEFFLWDPVKNEWQENVPENGKYFGTMMKVKLIWLGKNDDANLEQRVFRTYWPFFDTVEDEQLKLKALNSKSSTETNTNGNTL